MDKKYIDCRTIKINNKSHYYIRQQGFFFNDNPTKEKKILIAIHKKKEKNLGLIWSNLVAIHIKLIIFLCICRGELSPSFLVHAF